MRLGSLIRDLADLCYPPACAVCDGTADSWPLCRSCRDKLEVLCSHPYCPRCAMPLAEEAAPCPRCEGEGLYPYESVRRLASFDEPLRHLIHAVKFHHAWSVAEFLADRLCAQPGVDALLRDADAIVPVPLHPMRQMTRGYNQAEVIARRLGRRTGKRVLRTVVRLVHTEAQTETRSRTQRIENLRHAFGLLDPASVVGKRVVVVDDVRTTAATLQSIGRCLKQGKPSRLDALVIAVADPRGANFERI